VLLPALQRSKRGRLTVCDVFAASPASCRFRWHCVASAADADLCSCVPYCRCQDYHWWWRSFLTSGSSALYLFLYSILYFGEARSSAPALSARGSRSAALRSACCSSLMTFLRAANLAMTVLTHSAVTKLEIDQVTPAMLYFGYMLLVSFTFFILTGT
jgi:transmembrane 9 superfamily protein 2/4